MLDEVTIKGDWWLPGDPETRVFGEVRYSPEEGTILDLEGCLGEAHPDDPANIVIQGEDRGGTQITIFDAFWISWGDTSRWIGSPMVVGGHFNEIEDIVLNRILCRFNHLEEWTGGRSLEHNTFGEEWTATFKKPESHIFNVDSLNSDFHLMSLRSHKSDVRNNFTWSYRTVWKIEPQEPQTYQWFDPIIRDLTTLMTLLLGKPITIRQLNNERLQFYFNQVTIPKRNMHAGRFYLTYFQNIKNCFGDVLNNWFETIEQLRPAFGLLSSTFFHQRVSEKNFLSAIFALETYHRRRFGGTYFSNPDDYEPVKSALVAAIPSELPDGLRDSLKSRIKYGNEYALRKRLSLMLNSLEESTRKIIAQNTSRFVGSIVDTRNYFTHYTSELEQEAARNVDLFDHYLRIKALASVVFLKDLGIEEAMLAESVAQWGFDPAD